MTQTTLEIPDVQSMELAPNKFIYSTRTQLIATSHTGTTLWQVPLVLKRFEVSQSGTHLVGQLEENEGIVHVDLANGSLRADGNALGAALWNLSLSPSGRFSVATTRDTVFIFDNGIRLRDVKVPAKWLVSAAISDVGDVVVGAQDASHEGRIYLIGANGQGIAAVARPEEFDGYRPKVGFFPNGQQFYSNESNNLAVFSLR